MGFARRKERDMAAATRKEGEPRLPEESWLLQVHQEKRAVVRP
jgi:hypothetical protein